MKINFNNQLINNLVSFKVTSLVMTLSSVLFFFTLPTDAVVMDTRLVLGTLKKNIQQIEELHSVFPGSQKAANEQYQAALRSILDGEGAIQTGQVRESRLYLRQARDQVRYSQMKKSEYMLNQSRELLFKLSEAITLSQMNKAPMSKESLPGGQHGKKLDPIRLADDEKLIKKYFQKARSQAFRGEKFYRDGNYHYSLYLLKSSILYSMMSFEKSRFHLPNQFLAARQKWLVEEKAQSK